MMQMKKYINILILVNLFNFINGFKHYEYYNQKNCNKNINKKLCPFMNNNKNYKEKNVRIIYPKRKTSSNKYNYFRVDWESVISGCHASFNFEKRLANFYIRAAAPDSLSISEGYGGPDGSLVITDDELRRPENKYDSFAFTVSKNALALAGNFLGVDIRAQIQKLSAFLNPADIIKELQGINSSLQAFIRSAKQAQGILTLGQFIIKLALLFYKVFKFIILFFDLLALPLIFGTAGSQTKLQDVKDKAKDETDGVVRLLKAINGLLTVLLSFIRYLLSNTNELLIRLGILLAKLEGCEAVKNSDVILQLQQTQQDLIDLRDQLANFIR
jgi:hypothetical protein